MSLSSIEAALGHRFTRPELLQRALVHRSHTAEHPETLSNERMEFLGDAVLQLAVTHFIFQEYAGMAEGQMAKVRAASVSRDELAEVADGLGLGPHILMGRGEESSGGRLKPSILADAMEAVLAAVYLDAGLEVAKRLILELWSDRVRSKAVQPGRRDYKTRLQEALAAMGARPRYGAKGTGPDHRKQFEANVWLGDRLLGSGIGGSKKEAEQQAARVALEALQESRQP
ncbi:MAG: ribonuclease III [Acidimicrobiia bacterium]